MNNSWGSFARTFHVNTSPSCISLQVVEVCCDFLTKQLHPANCLGIQLFADTQGCQDLHRVAATYTAVREGGEGR